MHQTDPRRLTQTRLIEAALNVFAFLRYEHATVDDIAEAAGLSKGAFYANFSAKEDILVALFDQWSEERTKRVMAALDGSADPSARLHAMLLALFSYTDGANWPPLVLEFWSQGLAAGEVAKRLGPVYRQWTQLFSANIEAALGGQLTTTPEEAALLVLVTHDGLVAGVASGRLSSADLSAQRTAQVVLASLRGDEADAADLVEPSAAVLRASNS